MPKIDIIVPCYRYGRYLRACVGSVLGQSVRDLRVLIIDDASPDDTAEVAAEIARTDARVEVLRHTANRGHIATYNEGLEWASADYLLLLSADDLLAPGALARAAAIMDAHPEVALTHGRCPAWNDATPLPVLAGEPGSWTIEPGTAFIRRVCASGINPVHTPTAILRTAAQKRAGGYRPHLPHSGDLEMWLRIALEGRVATTLAVQAVRRFHAANMSAGFYADARADYQQCKAAFDSFFAACDSRLPDAARLHAKADAALAERAFWTGVGQLCRGERENGRWLLRFATDLCPRLRILPPLGRLMRSRDAAGRAVSALGALAAARLRRTVLP
jgi:GT2 family glycosyltransferase